MAAGPGCSFDILAGVMWFQRQKQYLLANGIAVMTVNTRLFDGVSLSLATPLFLVVVPLRSHGGQPLLHSSAVEH